VAASRVRRVHHLLVRRVLHRAARAAVDDLEVNAVRALAAADDAAAAEAGIVRGIPLVAIPRERAARDRLVAKGPATDGGGCSG